MNPGKHSMTNAEYHAAPGISSSMLKLLEESPKHLDNRELFKPESSSFHFGSLVHKLVLEPENVGSEFLVTPKFDMRTNVGKADKAAFEEETKGKILVTLDELIKAGKMRDNVLAIAGHLFNGGVKEQSFFVNDGHGTLVKCRPDCYFENDGIVIDLKTTSDITDFGMRKSVSSYNYAMSAAWYMRTLKMFGLKADTFVFVFVESYPPHMVKCRVLADETINFATKKIDKLMLDYAVYLKTRRADIIKTLLPFGEY